MLFGARTDQFNEFPLTSFRWQGQDKSQIVVHLCPYNTVRFQRRPRSSLPPTDLPHPPPRTQYTAQADVSDLLNTHKNHKSLQSAPTGLLTFGNGDGGGGPLPHMLETLRRCRAVSNNVEVGGGELPKVYVGGSVDDFYEDLLKRTDGGKELPTWCVFLSPSRKSNRN